jgi:hypothetical protein
MRALERSHAPARGALDQNMFGSGQALDLASSWRGLLAGLRHARFKTPLRKRRMRNVVYLDDLSVGRQFATGSQTLDEAQIKAFAANPSPSILTLSLPKRRP